MLNYRINIERKYLWAATLILVVLFAVVLVWALLDKIRYTSPIGLGDAVLPNRAIDSVKIYAGSEEDNPSGIAQVSRQDAYFLFVGDIMLDRNVEALIEKNGFDYLTKDLAESEFFSGYDLISANLEGPITKAGQYYPPEKEIDFAFKPKHVDSLKTQGFNYFSIANNHLYDQGKAGVEYTREYLDGIGADFSGDWEGRINDDSYTSIEIKGRNIGLVALSTIVVDLDADYLVQRMDEWSEMSDFLVVNIHWGAEYTAYPNEKQKELAYLLVDNGADLIIGHHPHVVQAVEVYDGAPIFYSLGNFIFDQYFSKETQQGLALAVDIGPRIGRIKIMPVQSQRSSLRLMTESEKAELFDFLSEVSGWEIKETIIFLHDSK